MDRPNNYVEDHDGFQFLPIAILKSSGHISFQELEGSEEISITDLMSEDLYLCVAALLEHDISIPDLKSAL